MRRKGRAMPVTSHLKWYDEKPVYEACEACGQPVGRLAHHKLGAALKDRTRHDAGRMALAPLPCLSMGILLGSSWAALGFEGFSETWNLALTFITTIVTAFSLAGVAPARRMSDLQLTALAGILYILHLVCVVASALFGEASEVLALGAASSLFEGAALACAGKTCLMAMARSGSRQAFLGVCGALFIANAWYFALIAAPQTAIALQWGLGEAAGMVLLVLGVRGGSSTGNVDDGTGAEVDALEGAAAPFAPNAPFIAFLVTSGTLMLVQGLFSAASGFGVDPIFHGPSSSILVLGVRAFMVLMCLTGLFCSFSYAGATAAFSTLWMLFIALSDIALFQRGAAWGVSLLGLGQYVLMAFVLMAGVRESAGKSREQSSAILGASLAIAMLNQPSRLVGLIFGSSLTPFELHAICAAFMVVVGTAATVALAVTVRAQFPRLSDTGEPLAAPLPQGDGTPAPFDGLPAVSGMLWRREQDFFARFIRFCETYQLTEREQEVLFEALHGYTVAAIAQKRGISQETVRTYLKRAYARAGCSNKQDLIVVMDEEGPH